MDGGGDQSHGVMSLDGFRRYLLEFKALFQTCRCRSSLHHLWEDGGAATN